MSADNPGGRSAEAEETADEPVAADRSAVSTDPPSSADPGSEGGLPKGGHQEPPEGGLVGERYRLVRLLGRGGHGRVYEAVHTHLDRRYALKVLGPPDDARGTKGRFEREAKLLSLLSHENIVGVVDAGIDPVRGQYLVLELVTGQTLADYIDKRITLNTPLLISLVEQLARGLQHAHQQKIIHRDLKPENIMLSPQPDGGYLVKILDFGIAKLTAPGPEAITRSGWSLGTAAYMAPEQARGGRDLDERVDVFALGVVVYEILAGKRPFDGSSYNETLFKVVSQPHESIRQHRPDLSKEVAAVLDRALCKQREGRYASVAEFADSLTLALRRSPTGAVLTTHSAVNRNQDNALLSTDVAPVSAMHASSAPAIGGRRKLLAFLGLALGGSLWMYVSTFESTDLPSPNPLSESTGRGSAAEANSTDPSPRAAEPSAPSGASLATSPTTTASVATSPSNTRPPSGDVPPVTELEHVSSEPERARPTVGKSTLRRGRPPKTQPPATPPPANTTPVPAASPKPAPPPGYVLDSPY